MASEASGELSDSMQEKSAKNYVMVAAIDFGTTFSGYAFSFATDEKDIRLFSDWGADVGIMQAFKTPTVVLTKNEGCEFVAFGYEALERYSDFDENEIGDYSIYEKFKMHLHKAKKIGHTTYISAKTGVPAKALTIFAHGLKYFSDHLMDLAETQMGSRPEKKDIRWVITVPAIWSESSKQFMREAAHQAEIIENKDSKSLLIALEPEVASLHCQHIDINYLATQRPNDTRMPVGTQYLVLDCGGGTLDVTVHELRANDRIAELHQATGSDLGGTQVDSNFVNLLRDIFGEDVIDCFQSECSANWLHMMSAFEQKKRSVNPKNKKVTTITISAELGYKWSQCNGGQTVKFAIAEKYKKLGVSIGSGMLRVPQDLMMELFSPVVNGIVNHVTHLLKVPVVKKATHMLVVGGFGECSVLQAALREAFGNRIKIIVPPNPSNCVMKGAVYFGHNPNAIISRISQKTYGTDVYPIFDPNKHDPGRTKLYGDERRAEGVFRTWIKHGDEVSTDKVLKFNHIPVSADQKNMAIGVYCSDLLDPRYCKDDGVDPLGSITVQLPGTGLERKVEVRIIFGGTEITVEGRDVIHGGVPTATTVKFLSD